MEEKSQVQLDLHIFNTTSSLSQYYPLNVMISRSIKGWRPEPGYPFKCGIEIHTQLKTKHKLFSLSKNSPGAAPNTCASYFDFGLPGTIPKLNPEALLLALRAAVALKSDISSISSFDRKHYFYMDQPLGYQITQHYQPLAKNGHLLLVPRLDDVEEAKTIHVEQIQLEQDTAKLNYNAYDGTVDIDHNRANVPLIEMVTKPDFSHLSELRAFVKKYISLMTHLGVCSGDMENGALRCDVNVSVAGGNRVEIKNLGSTSEIIAAAKYEYARQVQLLKHGKTPVEQETRSWDGTKTIRTRSKEDAIDYRYFPDVELPRIRLHPSIGKDLSQTLPELPEQLIQQLCEEPFLLEVKHARFLVENPDLYNYYKNLHHIIVDKHKLSYKVVNNWIIHEFIGAFNKLDIPVDVSVIDTEKFASLIIMVSEKKISITSAKLLLTQILQSPEDRELSIPDLIDAYDLGAVNDIHGDDLKEAIKEVCSEVIDSHPDVVTKIRNGKTKSINFLIGRAMKETQGKVDSKEFEKMFKKLIG